MSLPPQIRPTIERYLSLSAQQVPGLLTGFYVVGSVALDGFDERFSDIDFVAILSRPASSADLAALEAIHRDVGQTFPRWKLSGPYLQPGDLGQPEAKIEAHPYYHDGKLRPSGHFEVNDVTWWILKKHGLALLGPEPANLPFRVDWDMLIARMRENLNTYWVSWTTRLDGFLVMLSDWGIQWTVLGVLRQYFTFRENTITTKVKAGEYALTALPPEWHPIIREALHLRSGGQKSLYRSRFKRMLDAIRLLKFVIKESNRIFA